MTVRNSHLSRKTILERKRRRRKIILRLVIAVVVLAAIAAAVILITRKSGKTVTTRYLASTSASAEVYIYDDYERRLFRTNAPISRGTEVVVTDEEYTENGRTYVVVECGNETYYVKESSLVKSLDDIVQETDKWVRTSATVYASYEGPEIVSFVKKGTHLEITGYDELLDDGSANMYEVEYEDGKFGWVYSKYLVETQKQANEVNTEIYEIHKDRAFGSDLYGGSATTLDWFPYEKPHFKDNEIIQDARCMYLNAKAFERIDDYLELAKKSGVNSVVMDIKDGQLSCQFDCAAELSPTSNATYAHTQETVAAVAQKIKDAGMYLICRIVVFNDVLYGWDHPEDCIESEAATQTWPSAFSRNVWYYNLRLAEEVIEKFQPNEIQFDYLRFPEEAYNMSKNGDTDFKNVYNEEKAEAIQNFLFYACDNIHQFDVYVSVDVFAECAGKYVSAYGQYFPAISNIVDAISAMPYTDHFGFTVDTWSDPYTTVHDWALLAAARQTEIETPGLVRTWLTAYNVPWWRPTIKCDVDYFSKQAQALYDAGLTGGFMTWNGISNYSIYEQMGPAWGLDYTGGKGIDQAASTAESGEDTDSSEEELSDDTDSNDSGSDDDSGSGSEDEGN